MNADTLLSPIQELILFLIFLDLFLTLVLGKLIILIDFLLFFYNSASVSALKLNFFASTKI